MAKRILLICCLSFIHVPVFAVTPIPASVLFSDPNTHSLRMSPDGKYIAMYNTSNNFQTIEIVNPVKLESYILIKLYDKESLRIDDYDWIDNKTIYLSFGTRQGFLHIDYSGVKPTGKWLEIKTDGYLISPLQQEANKVLFAVESKDKTNLYRLSPEQLEKNDIDNAQSLNNELDGALHYYYDNNNNALMAVTNDETLLSFWVLNSNKWQKFLDIDKEIDFIPIGFLSDEKLAVLTDKDLKLTSLVEFNIKTQKLGDVIYQHPTYDLIGAGLNSIGAGIKYVRYIDHGIPRTQYFSAYGKKLTDILINTFKGQQVSILDSSEDGKKMLISSSSSYNPGKYFLFDKTLNKAIFFKEKFANLDGYPLTKSSTFITTTADNTNIESILTVPEQNSNGVLLVYPHGGPVGIRNDATYHPDIQFLVSRGYSVLNVNFRGSAGFGKGFMDKGKEQFGLLIEQDITAVVEHVRSLHHFEHMCSIGASYGGYSAVMLAMYNPQDYQCVVSMYGIYDLLHLFNASNYKTTKQFHKRIEDVVGEQNDKLKAVSPFYFVEKLQAPILLIAGREDEIADFEQANRMKYRLRQLSKDVETLFYKNVGHGHRDWIGEQHQFAYIDDFIRRKLNLAVPAGNEAAKALAEDARLIANGYSLDDNVDDDEQKAFEYYNKAANLGDAISMFKVGRFYQLGRYVEANSLAAVNWYKKASKAGSAEASLLLGKLYATGELLEKDPKLSYQMFSLANQQHSKFARLYLAQAACLGEGVAKSIEQCLQGLFFSNLNVKEKALVDSDVYEERRKVLDWVVWHQNFDQQEKTQFVSHMQADFKLDTVDLQVDEVDYGLFRQNKYNTRHQETTTIIPIKKGVLFGADLVFTSAASGSARIKSAVKIRWIVPEQIKHKTESHFTVFNPDKKFYTHFELSEDYELIEGNWTLEIMTLDDQPLFSKTFTTVKSE
ncbi:DUF3859 domain-containing protein [Neptunicella sp. SCSIO 80796]|uniref:DUF3859 domain-containing protein n=1 Tax=Neptunicella plasticusilytica TaxID=3117012 RepID=UPI003A4D931C